jgi:hypothetical protein
MTALSGLDQVEIRTPSRHGPTWCWFARANHPPLLLRPNWNCAGYRSRNRSKSTAFSSARCLVKARSRKVRSPRRRIVICPFILPPTLRYLRCRKSAPFDATILKRPRSSKVHCMRCDAAATKIRDVRDGNRTSRRVSGSEMACRRSRYRRRSHHAHQPWQRVWTGSADTEQTPPPAGA